MSTASIGCRASTSASTSRRSVPTSCTKGAVDLGLIPSIEYLRGPAEAPHTYRIVPGVSIASRGPVASVALFTREADPRCALDCARHQLADVGRARARPLRARVQDPADAATRAAAPRRHARHGGRGPAHRRQRLFLEADNHRAGAHLDEDRSGRGVDPDDRPAVRLRVLGRTAGRADAGGRGGAPAGAR